MLVKHPILSPDPYLQILPFPSQGTSLNPEAVEIPWLYQWISGSAHLPLPRETPASESQICTRVVGS